MKTSTKKKYTYFKTYENKVKSKSGKIYSYKRKRKITVYKTPKAKVAILVWITEQSRQTFLNATTLKYANKKAIEKYLKGVIKDDEYWHINYYRAGYTYVNEKTFLNMPSNEKEIYDFTNAATYGEAVAIIDNEYKKFSTSYNLHNYKRTIIKKRKRHSPKKGKGIQNKILVHI